MTKPIVRIFESGKKAADAAAKLEAEGFDKSIIFLLTPATSAAKPVDSLAAAIAAGNLLGAHAAFYADQIQAGRSVVAVRAPFGSGQLATDILESCDPVPPEVEPPPPALLPEVSSRAAPLSSFVGLPVLTRRHQAAPFSEFLGLSVLSRGRGFLSHMFTELTSPHFSFSSVLGLGLLTDKAAPLSSLFGVKTLLPEKRPWDSSLGMSLLSSEQAAPLSSKLGMPLLSRNAAPLSSALGLPVFTDRQ